MSTVKLHWLIIVLAVPALLSGCVQEYPFLPDPETLQTSGSAPPGTEIAVLRSGRTLTLSNCSSCHELYRPSAYTEAQWRKIIRLMSPRSNLTPEQAAAVEAYHLAAAKHAENKP